MIGHFLHRFSTLKDPGQVDLHGRTVGCDARGQGRIWSVCGLHAAAQHDATEGGGQCSPSNHSGAHPDSQSGQCRGDGGGSGEEGRGPPGGESSRCTPDQVGQGRGEGRAEGRSPDGQRPSSGGSAQANATGNSQLVAPAQESQAAAQTGNQGQGQRGGQQQRQLANWRRPDGYRQWPNRYNDRSGQWESKEAKELRELKEAMKALARGCDRGAAPRQRIHIVPPNGGGWQPMGYNPAAVRYRRSVAQAEGNQSGVPHESHEEYPPLQFVQCPPAETGGPGSGPNPDGCSQGPRSHRGHDIPVFAMGSDGQTPRQGGYAAGGACGYGYNGENLEVFGDVPECGREVPRVAEDGGQPQRGYYPLLPRGPESDGGVPPVVDDYEPNAEKQHLVIGATMRPAKPGRSPLAKYVEKVTRQL